MIELVPTCPLCEAPARPEPFPLADPDQFYFRCDYTRNGCGWLFSIPKPGTQTGRLDGAEPVPPRAPLSYQSVA
jgi:hypothetical protein